METIICIPRCLVRSLPIRFLLYPNTFIGYSVNQKPHGFPLKTCGNGISRGTKQDLHISNPTATSGYNLREEVVMKVRWKRGWRRWKKMARHNDRKKEAAPGRISFPRVSSEGRDTGDSWRCKGTCYPTCSDSKKRCAVVVVMRTGAIIPRRSGGYETHSARRCGKVKREAMPVYDDTGCGQRVEIGLAYG